MRLLGHKIVDFLLSEVVEKSHFKIIKPYENIYD